MAYQNILKSNLYSVQSTGSTLTLLLVITCTYLILTHDLWDYEHPRAEFAVT